MWVGAQAFPSVNDVSRGHSFSAGFGYQGGPSRSYRESHRPSSAPTMVRHPACTSSKNSLSVYSCHSATLRLWNACRVSPLLRHWRPFHVPLVENHSVQIVSSPTQY